MISLEKLTNGVRIVFTDSQYYLYGNGAIEIPSNALILVHDKSDAVTFLKPTGDVFVSAPLAEFNGMSWADIEDFYASSMVSAGGGSAVKEMYLGTEYDTVDADTGDITKYQVGDVVSGHTITEDDFHYLIYVYVNDEQKYSLTAVDMQNYITENEFKSGTTVVNHVVRGVTDPRSEKVYISYDASGNPASSADVMTVNESGFTVNNIQRAIDEASKKTVRKVAKKAEYVWDSVQQKMVLKLYDEYDVLINGIDFFDTNSLGQILLPNTVF